MSNQNFVDYVKMCCRSGKGGPGSTHFFRDNKNARGGPDGGHGGRGGHIILRGNKQLWTLLSLKYKKHVLAGDGGKGHGDHRSGAYGSDVTLDVPLGTVARDVETGKIEFEITEEGETRTLVSGGRGGLGNSHFKSPTNRTPMYSQPGEEGKEEWKILELKMLADVGLVGFPNAGKSTLLSVVSAAKPKIANYSFTTLVPNLGIVSHRDGQSFVMADIPGIIEKASEGKGIGLRFLRHIERNAVLLFLVSADADDITKEYNILLNELKQFNPELLDKPRILGISKADLIDDEIQELLNEELDIDIPYLYFSSISQQGITELKDMIWQMLN